MENSNENIPSSQTTEVVREFSQEALDAILKIDRECFPEEWRYPDANEYYAESLKNRQNINIFLLEKKRLIGYALAIPHNDAVKELKRYDSKLENKESGYYLETIGILPEFRGKGGLNIIFNTLCEEARVRGTFNFSAHARKKNKFNEKIKKYFSRVIIKSRQIKKWKFGGGEPFEYIEWLYEPTWELNAAKVSRRSFSWINEKAGLRYNSKLRSKEVFATQKIKKGEIVTIFGGYIIAKKDLEKMPASLFDEAIQIDEDFLIGIKNVSELESASFYNHSCRPNAGFNGQITLVAMKDIRKNEAITFDYAMNLYKMKSYRMRCCCGSKHCRKIITDEDWKIPALQKKYNGYFSHFIQKQINKKRGNNYDI